MLHGSHYEMGKVYSSIVGKSFIYFIISGQFQLDPEYIGLVFLSAPLAYVMAAPLVGKLTDKFVGQLYIHVHYVIVIVQ